MLGSEYFWDSNLSQSSLRDRECNGPNQMHANSTMNIHAKIIKNLNLTALLELTLYA